MYTFPWIVLGEGVAPNTVHSTRMTSWNCRMGLSIHVRTNTFPHWHPQGLSIENQLAPLVIGMIWIWIQISVCFLHEVPPIILHVPCQHLELALSSDGHKVFNLKRCGCAGLEILENELVRLDCLVWRWSPDIPRITREEMLKYNLWSTLSWNILKLK